MKDDSGRIQNAIGEFIAIGEEKRRQYIKLLIGSLLVGDYSLHGENIGVVVDVNNKRLVRVDMGSAFKPAYTGVKDKIGTQDTGGKGWIKKIMGFNKNYFARLHNPYIRNDPELIPLLDQEFEALQITILTNGLEEIIKKSLKDIKEYYNIPDTDTVYYDIAKEITGIKDGGEENLQSSDIDKGVDNILEYLEIRQVKVQEYIDSFEDNY